MSWLNQHKQHASHQPKEGVMKLKSLKSWLFIAALAVVASASKSYAVTSQPIDIKVSITATKSLAAGTTTYDYGALTVNASSVSSSILITNDSTSLVETYRIQGANAISDTGGTNWTLAASTGTDQYALGAQFSSAQPSDADGSWGTDDLTTSAVTCSSTQFGNGTAAQSGAAVSPVTSTTRNLWFRLRTPGAVTDSSRHTVTVTLSVL